MISTSCRSWLFVPGDDPKKLAKAASTSADAVIFDLEDAVAPGAKVGARATLAAFLRSGEAGVASRWVRINPLEAGGDEDLEAVAGEPLDGIVLPKAEGRQALGLLDAALKRFESRDRSPLAVMAIIETALGVMLLPELAHGAPRLTALTWGAEDLAADVGASRRRAGATWIGAFEHARSALLLSAKAAGVDAIDTVLPDFRDVDFIVQDSALSAADGFTGRLTIHPAQVPPVNAAYSPTDADLRRARRIIEAFDAAPGAGVVGIDGVMTDRPHLLWAQRLLARGALSGDRP